MLKTSGKTITLKNFSLMKKGSPIYYAENIGIENYGFGNVLTLRNEGERILDEEESGVFGGLEEIDDIDTRKEGSYNFFWITSNGDIYLKGTNSVRDGDGRVIQISNSGKYPSIKCMGMGENGKIIFSYRSSVGAILGRIHTGEATGGTATTLVDSGVDFTSLGLANGDTVYNISNGGAETITNIAAHTLTNTSGTPFASGDEYCIVDPDWQTMDANAEHDWGQQIIEFDESFYILNGSWLDVVDSAGAHHNKDKALESEWIARTGASNGDSLVVGANKNYKGKLFIWDKHSVGWLKKTALDDEIQSITTWNNNYIYMSGNSIWMTDGYNIRKLSDFPDSDDSSEANVLPKGMVVVGNKLIINGGMNRINKAKNGIWIYDLIREEWAYNPYEPGGKGNKVSYEIKNGIVFYEGYKNEVCYSFWNNGKGWDNCYVLSQFELGDDSKRGTVITNPIRLGKGARLKKIEVNLVQDLKNYYIYDGHSKAFSCKLSDCTRPAWSYYWTEAVSVNKKILKVDGTMFAIASAKIGDEILILNGWNGYLRRKIVSWDNRGTDTEEWTLNEDLDELTADATTFQIMPFQEYGMTEKTLTEAGMLEFYPNFYGDNVMIELTAIGDTTPKLAIESIKLYFE